MLSSFLSNIFNQIKKIFLNPVVIGIFTTLKPFYIATFVTIILVTYWVFQGLSKANLIKPVQTVIFQAFNETKSVAQNCVPMIKDFSRFWQCLNNPPEYKKQEDEQNLEKSFIDLLPGNNEEYDPYAQP